jgi:hypothetical protein
MLIQDGEILPAAFSLSVCYTPPAAASIALGLTAGYTALYPGGDKFEPALQSAAASLIAGAAVPAGDAASGPACVLVYADEELPPEYRPLMPDAPPSTAFALLLGANEGLPLPSGADAETPRAFLQALARHTDLQCPPAKDMR